VSDPVIINGVNTDYMVGYKDKSLLVGRLFDFQMGVSSSSNGLALNGPANQSNN